MKWVIIIETWYETVGQRLLPLFPSVLKQNDR